VPLLSSRRPGRAWPRRRQPCTGSHESVRGGDVDDAAPALGPHCGNSGFHRIEGGREIEPDDRLPAFFGKLLDRRDELNAGVIDEHVDTAEDVNGLADESATSSDAIDRRRPKATLTQTPRRVVRAKVSISSASPKPFIMTRLRPRRASGQCPTRCTRRARNERDLSFSVIRHSLSRAGERQFERNLHRHNEHSGLLNTDKVWPRMPG